MERGGGAAASAARDRAQSPHARRLMGGGVLYVRVRSAADLDFSQKSLLLGGWKRNVKVRPCLLVVYFACALAAAPLLQKNNKKNTETTASCAGQGAVRGPGESHVGVAGRHHTYSYDSELEFVVDGDQAGRDGGGEVRLEV
jgi:hypothetical protein